MKSVGGLALFALGLGIAMPAQAASDKRDFETCDGRVHPGKQDDGMRGEAGTSPYSFGNKDVIGACTRALQSPRLLPTQTLRKAHLLRARAAEYLGKEDAAAALADIDAAESAAGPLASDIFYQRSMGVSLKLLRAIALAQQGDMPGAEKLAREALAIRPYSLQVQRHSALILQAARPVGIASPSPWSAAIPLDPEMSAIALGKEAEVGNFKGVLAFQPAVSLEWPGTPISSLNFLAQNQSAMQLVSTIGNALSIAYARAATGDAEGARRDVADVRSHLATLLQPPVTTDAAKPAAVAFPQLGDALTRLVDDRVRRIEARIAIAEGHTAQATASLVGARLPEDATTLELLTALGASSSATAKPDLTSFAAGMRENRRKALAKAASGALIAPETPRSVVDYEKARPDILGALVGGALTMGVSLLGGIDRTDGFRMTPNVDGTMNVEFLGNTPSAALVQEMTLLRAAELTREAGKSSFVIVARKDYARNMVSTRHGIEVGRTPMGYKTELTIRCLDAAAGGTPDTGIARALNATTIIDALGPLYYETKHT